MGILLFCLLWGIVLLEEIERIPPEEWSAHGLRHVWRLRRPRANFTFLLALAVGAFLLWFEVRLILLGRSTFHPIQALALADVLFGGFLYARSEEVPSVKARPTASSTRTHKCVRALRALAFCAPVKSDVGA